MPFPRQGGNVNSLGAALAEPRGNIKLLRRKVSDAFPPVGGNVNSPGCSASGTRGNIKQKSRSGRGARKQNGFVEMDKANGQNRMDEVDRAWT